MSLLGDTLRAQRRETAFGTFLVCVHQAAETAVPVLIGATIDNAVLQRDGAALGLWLAILAANFLFLGLAGLWGYHLVDRAEVRGAHRLRLLLVDRVLAAEGGTEAVARTGQVVALGTADATRAASVVWAVALALSGLVALVIAAVVLLLASPLLGVVVLVGLPAVLVAAQRLAGPLQGRAEREQEAAAQTTATAVDLVAGVRVLSGLGAQEAATARYRTASRRTLRRRIAAANALGAFEGATLALSGIFLIAVGWLAARMTLDGTITVGELIAVVGLVQFLTEPLERVAQSFGVLASARGSAGRIAALLAAAPAVDPGDAGRAGHVRGELRIGDELRIPAGEFVALDIPDPGTAQRLVDVLGRHVEPDDALLLDGTDLRSIGLDAARAAIHVADHEPWLPAGTLGQALDGVPDWALHAAAADQVLDVVGADADLGQEGAALSGGQRQRIALARALALQTPVLVLHEPTTAVDTLTEQQIATRLREVRAGRTTLVLTSSPVLRAVARRGEDVP